MFVRLVTGLRCISSSEETAKASGEPPASSGPLPADWNDSGDVYCLYYKHAASPNALFTLKIIVMDDVLLVTCASVVLAVLRFHAG